MADTYTTNLNLKKPGYDSPADIADINANMDKIDNSVSQLSQQVADYRTAVNLLGNSNFIKFVAQAGISKNHEVDEVYAGDRWILLSGTLTAKANINGDGYTDVTLNGTICQKLADAPAKATPAIGMVSGTATIAYSDGVVTITSAGGVIKWAALYDGEYAADNLPPYVPKGYAVELAECQRYYREYEEIAIIPSSSQWKQVIGGIFDMRAIPTLTIGSVKNLSSEELPYKVIDQRISKNGLFMICLDNAASDATKIANVAFAADL